MRQRTGCHIGTDVAHHDAAENLAGRGAHAAPDVLTPRWQSVALPVDGFGSREYRGRDLGLCQFNPTPTANRSAKVAQGGTQVS